jgi:hypothetical protein
MKSCFENKKTTLFGWHLKFSSVLHQIAKIVLFKIHNRKLTAKTGKKCSIVAS